MSEPAEHANQLPVAVIRADAKGEVLALDLLEESTETFGLVVGSNLAKTHPVAWRHALRVADEGGWLGRARTFSHRVGLGSQAVSVIAQRNELRLFIGSPSLKWRPEDHLEVLLTIAQSTQDVIQIVEGIPTQESARVVFANDAWSKMTGFPVTEILGRPPNFLANLATTPERAVELTTRLKEGMPSRARCLTRHASGKPLEVEVEMLPVLDSAEELVYWVALNRPVGKEAPETDQDRDRRLDALGRLAGGLAHEFNNVLATATSNLGYVRMALTGDDAALKLDEVHGVIAEVEASLLAAASLSNRLLTFSTGGSPVRRPLDVTARLTVWVGSSMKPRVCPHVITKGDAPPLVDGDRGQLRRAFDELTCFLRRSPEAREPVLVHADRLIANPGSGMVPGDYLRVTLTQAGVVLPQDELLHAFEPWSTPEQEHPLGMPIAWSIVRRHGGSLTLENTQVGLRATVLLPGIELTSESADVGHVTPSSGIERPLHLLVMDDEELIRNTLRRVLRRIGHRVVLSADGESAVSEYQAAKNRNDPFDVVLLDLTVERGMGGAQAFELLRAFDPSTVAVIVSGYSSGPVISSYRELGFAGYLPKPFSIEELQGALQHAIARDRSAPS